MGFDIGGLIGNIVGKVANQAIQSFAKQMFGGGGAGGVDFGSIFSNAIKGLFQDSNKTGDDKASKQGQNSDVVNQFARDIGKTAANSIRNGSTIGEFGDAVAGKFNMATSDAPRDRNGDLQFDA